MAKKIFLEKNGNFYIDGYKMIYFYCNNGIYSKFPISWRIRENLNFMNIHDLNLIYYEIDEDCSNDFQYILSFKNQQKSQCKNNITNKIDRKISELILIINDKEKIESLVEYIIKDGPAKSYDKVKYLLEIISSYRNIMNILVFKYINKICDRYKFHDKNNVKYFEVLLMNHLPPERIIFDAQGI